MNGSPFDALVPMEALRQGRVDLWCVWLQRVADPDLLRQYRGLLTPEEAEQERRFRREESKLQLLASRALLRFALSHYAGLPLHAWEFQRNPHGKPRLVPPDESLASLQFNQSHTAGLVVCAFAVGSDLGVDVEDSTRIRDSSNLADRYFAPAEAACLRDLPPEGRQVAFYRLWTLKEAFIKARGTGLAMPLKSFAISIAPDQPPRLAGEEGGDWQFAELRLPPSYQVALAIRRPASQKLSLHFREAVPLRSIDPGSHF